jgi:uncharacterized protein with von Willebrand factor type A (vWA) domain
MHICRYYHDELLPEPLREELEESMYHALVGEEPVADQTGAPDTPVRKALDRLLGVTDFSRYTRENSRLSERIAHEAVHWVGHRWHEIKEDEELAAEARLLEQAGQSTDEPDSDAIRALARQVVSQRPELAGRAAAATRTLEAAVLQGSNHAERRMRSDKQARYSYLLRSWREAHERTRRTHQERELGRAVGQFVRELQEIVPRLAQEQQLVRDVFGNEDALFDLSRHEWEELPMDGLQQAAVMLGEHQEISAMAETIGRSQAVSERRRVEQTVRRVRERQVGVGKAEIVGVRNGNDIGSLMPSEVALLSHPSTEQLFYARLARSELLVLDYRQRRLVRDEVEHLAWVDAEVLVPRGPVVLCVDTSGSMLGLPEKVAKAVVLALAKRLQSDRRRIEVLAFASQVRSFSLDHEKNTLPDLVSFLAGGFHGGTDLTRALVEALDLLETREARHADVLVISDFKVPKIADRHIGRIGRQHRRGTLFHSLTVSPGAIIDPLHIFDTTWHFDTTAGRMTQDALRRV